VVWQLAERFPREEYYVSLQDISPKDQLTLVLLYREEQAVSVPWRTSSTNARYSYGVSPR
jgi:hypothetical protein